MGLPRLHMRYSEIITQDGEVVPALTPINSFWDNICRKNLALDSEYWIKSDFERSSKSHRHYFATISEGWAQLPEKYSNQFPGKDGDELLRKHALIKAGYHHMSTFVFDTPQDAKMAAMMAENLTDPERYCVVIVSDNVVQRYYPETQRYKEMGGARFQKSKSDVLEIIADMIGISVAELAAHAKEEE